MVTQTTKWVTKKGWWLSCCQSPVTRRMDALWGPQTELEGVEPGEGRGRTTKKLRLGWQWEGLSLQPKSPGRWWGLLSEHSGARVVLLKSRLSATVDSRLWEAREGVRSRPHRTALCSPRGGAGWGKGGVLSDGWQNWKHSLARQAGWQFAKLPGHWLLSWLKQGALDKY